MELQETPRSNRSSVDEPNPQALKEVSEALHKEFDWFRRTSRVQVLENVPEDVAVKILRETYCPLGPKPVTLPVPPATIPGVFFTLPQACRTAALRACAPCIDEDQSLHISVGSPACMEMLAAALPSVPALRSVKLTVEFEAPEEEPYGRMLRALCALPQLTYLCLSDGAVMDHHILSLSLAVLQTTQLQVLVMDTVPATTEPGRACAHALVTLPKLTRVHFTTTETLASTPELLRAREIPLWNMRELHFDRIALSDADVVAFLRGAQVLPSVEVFRLGYDADRYGYGAHDELTVEIMAEGSTAFPLARDLQIRDYRSASAAGLAAELRGRVGGCPHLTRLDLSFSLHRGDSADVAELLRTITGLSALVLRQPSDGEGLEAQEYASGLAGMVRLTHLDLSGSHLSGPGAAALADALGGLTGLLSLSLSDVLLFGTSLAENESAEACMSRGLARLGHLSELRLENCFMSLEPLANTLEGMGELRELWLRGTVLGAGAARALAQGLMHVPGLRVLDLSQSMLDPPGLQGLALGLAALGGLTQLRLSFCQMGREGALVLAGALCPEAVAGKRVRHTSEPQLVVLDVSHSRLGREGVAALLPALLKMPRLREFNVQQSERVLSDGMLQDLRAANEHLYVCR